MLLAILRQFLRALERAHLLLNLITPLNTISLLNNHIATVQISVSLTDVASYTPGQVRRQRHQSSPVYPEVSFRRLLIITAS